MRYFLLDLCTELMLEWDKHLWEFEMFAAASAVLYLQYFKYFFNIRSQQQPGGWTGDVTVTRGFLFGEEPAVT